MSIDKASITSEQEALGIGPEARIVDEYLLSEIGSGSRSDRWQSVSAILDRGPLANLAVDEATGLALGYVQSGKTSSIISLLAAAADQGYQLLVALLGGTNLLLDQNLKRIEQTLGLDHRTDYRWVTVLNPDGRADSDEIRGWLERGRFVIVPILKHAKRIRDVAESLSYLNLEDMPALIVDDEADQASLNVDNQNGQSATYGAIGELRDALPRNLYVQYTATPYAPLLLEPHDHLLPEFVEFLQPGPGYVGGREFFVDHAETVVRNVPAVEEQQAAQLPAFLPLSLQRALASFIAGSSLLLGHDTDNAPVSMLVHSTQRNDVQDRYRFLLQNQLDDWRDDARAAACASDLPDLVVDERVRLVQNGAVDLSDDQFLKGVRDSLAEATLWLVNSKSEVNRVKWNVAPVHILVGGNKLDRGFTVEGLTVTYMNRPPSAQIDTLEQRARAFGYRGDLLPYCQFFATKHSVSVLRDIVYTEYDLRAGLRDHLAEGRSVDEWATEVGLLLPPATRPTRQAVVTALSTGMAGWRSLRYPGLSDDLRCYNERLVRDLGLFDAPYSDYGRLAHRTLEMPLDEVIDRLIEPWRVETYSPDWRHGDIVNALRRNPHRSQTVPVLLLGEPEQPRVRRWDDRLGFVNLFQGRDVRPAPGAPFYPGDRSVPSVESDPDRVVIQIHCVTRRDRHDPYTLLTPAVYLGQRPIVTRS